MISTIDLKSHQYRIYFKFNSFNIILNLNKLIKKFEFERHLNKLSQSVDGKFQNVVANYSREISCVENVH